MDYKTDVKLGKYDEYVSIGNKCPTAITLKSLNLRHHSFPFDWIPLLPKQVLKYIKNNFKDFIPTKGILNEENIWFGHFNLSDKETIATIHRRIKRLYELLESTKKVLFVYTSEADIYNEMKSHTNEPNNYTDILSLRDHLLIQYPQLQFDILAVSMNATHKNSNNIINVTINVEDKYLSNNMETHTDWCYDVYRRVLMKLFSEIS